LVRSQGSQKSIHVLHVCRERKSCEEAPSDRNISDWVGFAQVPARSDLASVLARAEVASTEVNAAQVQTATSLAKLKSVQDSVAREGLEVQLRQLQSSMNSASNSNQADRLSAFSANANAAWSGLTKSSQLAVESNGAFVEAKEATLRLVTALKGSVAAGAAREELDRPGSGRQAVAIEAEKRLLAFRAERTSAQGKARALEEQMVRARANHQRLVSEALSTGNMGKAREADMAAADVSRLAAEAAAAYAQATRLASAEVQFAQLMADSYAELGREALGWAKLLQPKQRTAR
jgi:hypothetical protein